MHNYTTATCYTLSEDPALQTFHQIDIPKMGFEHKPVLHVILGLSAMHLAHFRPNQREFYLEHAEKHYQAGFQIASRLLRAVNRDNCHSLFVFASMCNSFILAKGPQPGNFLLFDDKGPAEWITLFRGVKPVLELYGPDIQSGILAPMIQANIPNGPPHKSILPPSESDQLDHLRDMIEKTSSSDDSQTLLEALGNLESLFRSKMGSDGQKKSLQFRNLGAWLYRCSEEFTSLLQKHHPAALAIFAHACVALNDLSSTWAMAGWIPHLLRGIWERLPREYHSWMQWPIRQIGWIPPD
jgi:hypothetical protein